MAWKISWHEIQKEILTLWKSKDVIENVHPVPDIPPIVLLLVDMGAMGLTNHWQSIRLILKVAELYIDVYFSKQNSLLLISLPPPSRY